MGKVEYYTVAEIAPILKVNVDAFRRAAREKPKDYPFPIIAYGSRVKIPKIPFDNFLKQCGVELQ